MAHTSTPTKHTMYEQQKPTTYTQDQPTPHQDDDFDMDTQFDIDDQLENITPVRGTNSLQLSYTNINYHAYRLGMHTCTRVFDLANKTPPILSHHNPREHNHIAFLEHHVAFANV